jgi:hypothetical protein
LVSPVRVHDTVGAVAAQVAPPGDADTAYEAIVPPLPAGAVHDTATCPSPGAAVTTGADGYPLHAAAAAVEAVEVHPFNRAFTVGVTAAAGTVTDAETPDTAVTTVDVPSLTSYDNPAGGDATGVQDTRHVVAAVRDAVTADGTYAFS